jgi:hypothetical protein
MTHRHRGRALDDRGGRWVPATGAVSTGERQDPYPAGGDDEHDELSDSPHRHHVDTVDGAKTAQTRQRRIDKAVPLFGSGRKH